MAPVQFGSVTVSGWNGSSGSGFRFWRFLKGGGGFCVPMQQECSMMYLSWVHFLMLLMLREGLRKNKRLKGFHPRRSGAQQLKGKVQKGPGSVRFGYGFGMERFERFRFSVLAVPLRRGFL